MPVIPQCTGPVEMWVRFASNAGLQVTRQDPEYHSWVLLGFGEYGAEVESIAEYEPIHSEWSGDSVQHDEFFKGLYIVVASKLTRWNKLIYERIRAISMGATNHDYNPETAGTITRLCIGSMMRANRWHMNLGLRFQLHNEVLFFPFATTHGNLMDPLGSRPNAASVTFLCGGDFRKASWSAEVYRSISEQNSLFLPELVDGESYSGYGSD